MLIVSLVLLCALPCNARTWVHVEDPGPDNGFHTHWLDDFHGRLIMGTWLGIRVYDFDTETWTLIESRPGGGQIKRAVLGHPDDPQHLLVGNHWHSNGNDGGSIWLSEDLWSTSESVFSNGEGVFDLVMFPTGGVPYFAACGIDGVYRSQDGGFDWTAALESVGDIRCVEAGPSGTIYASGADVIRISADSGETWAPLMPSEPGFLSFDILKADPHADGHLFIGSNSAGSDEHIGLYETYHDGEYWTKLLPGQVRAIDIYSDDPDLIAIIRQEGEDRTISLSMDGGLSWSDWTGTLDTTYLNRVFFSQSDQRLYAYCYEGLWATDLFPTSTEAPPFIPSFRAYPNPLNPATELTFVLTEPAVVALDIFCPSGRRVIKLLAGIPFNAGRHSVTWDGRDEAGRELPSGMYFARINAGTLGAIVKLVLLK